MANMNDRNRAFCLTSQTLDQSVAFSYSAKSDGHVRIAVGNVVDVTDNHVTLRDRVRGGSFRTFILDRVRGSVIRMPSW